MNVAVVGSGISGLVCAYVLSRRHAVTLFESSSRFGGHTNTAIVHGAADGGGDLPVDTGFIVFNERNYPNFTRLLAGLRIASHPAPMSFSVRCERTGLEYGGAGLGGVFAQRRNLLRPGFWRMLLDIRRFAREGKRAAGARPPETPLALFLESEGYSTRFIEDYLLPMAGALWSAPRTSAAQLPLGFFIRFFDQHGMLELRERPVWRTITGGSCRYVDALLEEVRERGGQACAGSPIASLRRSASRAELTLADGRTLGFDHAVLAVHADQALSLLADPTEAEHRVLASFPYQYNEAVLHTDARLLPARRAAWSAWNYHRSADQPVGSAASGGAASVAVTYNLSILQSLPQPPGDRWTRPMCVTLNRTGAIDPSKIIVTMPYHHPVYTPAGFAAQQTNQWRAISSFERRTHYCGAYWGNGFHEDGVVSALRVCQDFDLTL